MLSEILKKIVEESTNEGIRFIEHTTEVFVSYKELYNDAIGLGEWLKEKGMKPGESLVILLQNRKNFITTFWTCLIFGYTAIPVDYISAWNKSWGIKNVENVFQNITNNKVITDKKQYEIISQNKYIKSSDIFIFPEIENIKRDWKKNWFKVIDTEYPAVILFTSGSVFLPKGVVLTTENLLNGIEQVIQKIHYNKSDVIINWMPLTHVAGLLLLHLIPLCSGANEVVVSTEDFLRNPRGFFDYVKKYKGTVKTKYEAETLMRAARDEGYNINIFRMGNISCELKGGKFQKNIEQNAFYILTRSFLRLGILPLSEQKTVDLTYVDSAARAIYLLATRKNLNNETYHIENTELLSFTHMGKMIQKYGENVVLRPYEDMWDYFLPIYEEGTDNSKMQEINNLIAYIDFLPWHMPTMFRFVKDKTKILLEKMGFAWKEPDQEIIDNLLDYGKQVGFFD